MHTIATQLQDKRLAISFSSGFFGFFHHAGILKALAEMGLHPTRVSGTSAGALVAAMFAAGKSPEDICQTFLKIRRNDFWDVTFPFYANGFRLLKGQKFKELLTAILGDVTFAQLNFPLSVGACSVDDGRSRYLSEGRLVDAVLASCALPYLFPQVEINGRLYMDGGIQEKSPLQPFFEASDIDAVVACILPPRERRGKDANAGGRISFFIDTPLEERLERETASLNTLKEKGLPVYAIRPTFIPVSPFKLQKANEAMDLAYQDAMKFLNAPPAD